MAGEISVSVATRSGRAEATRRLTSPPRELPSRCTGRPSASPGSWTMCSRTSTTARTWPRMEYRPRTGGCERPNPGRSSAQPSNRTASSAARSVQFVDAPPSPWTKSARSRVAPSVGPSTGPVPGVVRTYTTPPRTGSCCPGQGGSNDVSWGKGVADGCAAGTSAAATSGGGASDIDPTVILRTAGMRFVNPPVTSPVSCSRRVPSPRATGARPASHGVPAGCSCCARPRTCSSPRASTRPPWTPPPTAPAAARASSADRAGCGKPVLYQHFPGKRELYLALLEEHVSELADRVAEAMGGTDDNRARVDGAVRAYFDFIDAEGEAFRLVFESDLRNDADVRAIVDRGTGVCVEAIAGIIAADTGADPERALLLASGLTGLAETSARWWLPRKGTVSRAEAVSLMSALSWRGISGFPRVE